MDELLDFAKPFDYALFTRIVDSYTQNANMELKQSASNVLMRFHEDPRSHNYAFDILSVERSAQQPYTRYIGLLLLESLVRRNWYLLSLAKQVELYQYVLAEGRHCLLYDDVVRAKYIAIYVLICLLTYPEKYSAFLRETCVADMVRTAEPLRVLNNLAIVENFLDDFALKGGTVLVCQHREAIRVQLGGEAPLILGFAVEALGHGLATANGYMIAGALRLLTVAMQFVCRHLNGSAVFPFVDRIHGGVSTVFAAFFGRDGAPPALGPGTVSAAHEQEILCSAFRVVGLLFEALKFDSSSHRSFIVDLFDYLVDTVEAHVCTVSRAVVGGPAPPAPAAAAAAAGRPGGGFWPPVATAVFRLQPRRPAYQALATTGVSFALQRALLHGLVFAETSAVDALPRETPLPIALSLLRPGGAGAGARTGAGAGGAAQRDNPCLRKIRRIHAAVGLLVAALQHSHLEQANIDLVLVAFFATLANQLQMLNPGRPSLKRIDLYRDFFAPLSLFLCQTLPRPSSVLVDCDDYGNVVTTRMEDSEQAHVFEQTIACIGNVTRLLGDAAFCAEATAALAGGFSIGLVNALAWCLRGVAAGLARPKQDALIVGTISRLVQLCASVGTLQEKAVCTSGVMFICSQMPDFMRTNERLLNTVLLKLLDFACFEVEGIRAMAVDCVHDLLRRLCVPGAAARPVSDALRVFRAEGRGRGRGGAGSAGGASVGDTGAGCVGAADAPRGLGGVETSETLLRRFLGELERGDPYGLRAGAAGAGATAETGASASSSAGAKPPAVPPYFASSEYLALLLRLPDVAGHLREHEIIRLYEAVVLPIRANDAFLARIYDPLLGLFQASWDAGLGLAGDAAADTETLRRLDTQPADGGSGGGSSSGGGGVPATSALCGRLRTLTTVCTVLTGAASGCRNQVVSTYVSGILGPLGSLYEALQGLAVLLASGAHKPFGPASLTAVFSLRRAISNLLREAVLAARPDVLRAYLEQGTLVRVFQQYVKSFDTYAGLAKDRAFVDAAVLEAVVDHRVLALGHALFAQASAAFAPTDCGLGEVLFIGVLRPTFAFLTAVSSYAANLELSADFFRFTLALSHYVLSDTGVQLNPFIAACPPDVLWNYLQPALGALDAICTLQAFGGLYGAALSSVKALLLLLGTDALRPQARAHPAVFEALLRHTVGLLHMSEQRTDHVILLDLAALVTRETGADALQALLRRLLPSISQESMEYFTSGLASWSLDTAVDLIVVLRLVGFFLK